jgi:hypothetical protein
LDEDESCFATSHMMIDGDGVGPSHGDPDYQNETSYKPDLNADIDPYFVLPPIVFSSVRPRVLGCRAQIKNKVSGKLIASVVGDQGPAKKLGEASICSARLMGVPSSPVTGGDDRVIYEYRWWPGVPAVIDGRVFELQSWRK